VPRFTRTADLITTDAIGKQVAAELGSADALFLVNHGIVTVGPDLQTATVRAVILEQAAKQQMLTHTMGGWPTWSHQSESIAKREHIYTPRAIHAVWNYLARSLPEVAGR
jgi:ribulose-5-phosphate 4-epimerase/fuculose-1-phosphate aldolase